MTSAAIDLGATCLRVAYRDRDGLQVARAASGADAVPAIVWFADGDGARAGEAAVGGPPEEVVTSVRADLRVDSRATARDRYFHGQFRSPESVAGYLLADAARRAGAASGTPVRDITLGVPTVADDSAGLRRAAAAARLTVADTIAEPVAVALHYGAVSDGVDHVTVVHDLGGTTLDVAVLRIIGRNVAILRSARHAIGGIRWDAALAAELLAEAGVGGAPDADALAAAERLRVGLSDAEQASGRLTGPGFERDVRVDRARLEEVTAHLLGRVVDFTRETIEEAVRAGGERPDTILLAGGANQMPVIGRALAGQLGLDIRVSEPRLAVVRGLALARDFGLLFVTGQEGEPLTLPPARSARAQVPGSQERQVPGTAGAAVADPEPQAAHGEAQVNDPEPQAADPEPRPSRPEPVPVAGTGAPRAAPAGAAPRRPAPPAAPPPPPGAAGSRTADPGADPGPAARPQPPGVVLSGGPPNAERMSGLPVGQLHALRRGDRLLLTWIWPEDTVAAQVRWESDEDRPGLHGSARCSRRMYEHDGGFELPVGQAGVTITVEALAYGERLDGEPPSSLRVEPPRPAVRYDPLVRKGRRNWEVTVTFTAAADCSLPDVLVVRGTGSYMPASISEGEVVHVVSGRPLIAGSPFGATFGLAPQRGTCWLVCLLADDDGDDTAHVDLRPASLHRLRVN